MKVGTFNVENNKDVSNLEIWANIQTKGEGQGWLAWKKSLLL